MLSAKKELFTPSGGGYQISRSVRLRSSASAYLSRTLTTPTDRKKWTWSGWIKRSNFPATYVHIFGTGTASSDTATTQIQFYQDNLYVSGFATGWLKTNAVYRDPSAWYHIVVAWDNANATASNRCKIFVNGVETTYSVDNRASLSTTTDYGMNYATLHTIGAWSWNNGTFAQPEYFDGYMTDVNFIDGQALTPSSFGETNAVTGVWQPKKYAGTYGTNGFYLNFSDNSTAAALGTDFSGNSNTWTVNNISVTAGVTYDSMIDVPTLYADGGNGRGNYATLNPLDKLLSPTVVDGNLGATVGDNAEVRGTIYVSSGKWYWEVVPTTMTFSFVGIGIGGATKHWATTGISYYGANGNKYVNGTASAYGASYTNNDVIGVALDLDNLQITFYKNNTSQGTITGLTAGSYALALSAAGNSSVYTANFGQRPFSYTPPTGFKALNTQNLPDATIKKGNAYFDATTYTGNGSTQSIVNSGAMQPDLVWAKARSTATHGALVDSVRGVDKYLYSSLTIAEETQTTALSSFNANGFSLAGSFSNVNANGTTYVAWQWDAGTTTVTNTSGSISSQVRANTTAGFSVVTYTGTGANATVGHGLGVAPKMMILINRDTTHDNIVWHTAFTATERIYLNLTNAKDTGATTSFNSTLPSSSVISLGSNLYTNGSTNKMVAYCFSEVAGYSAFGKYTGNGSTDGPFTYLGFRPRFIIFKRTDGVGSWFMEDSSRGTYNVMGPELYAESSAAEATSNRLDFLSNGFKMRAANAGDNANGGTYIYMAFAEVPFKYSLGR